jgi:hypothetical protein
MISSNFDEKLVALRKRGKKAEATAKTQQLALPFWPEEVRSVPNAVLRGALFTVSKERAVLKDLTPIAAVDGIEIRAKNDRLNQVDLDLWEMLLHLQRIHPLGNRVEFTAHAMLKALGRTTGGKDHQWLDNALARLIGSVVEIKWTRERKAFAGALVSSFFRDDDTGRYVVKFNQEMATLYGQGHTYIDWEQRQALGQNNLAKWLHGFYTTHAAPFGYKVETLQKLCGSTVERLGDFRKLLRTALGKLVDIGAIGGWQIDAETDMVTVQKEPTTTQRRHLARSKRR